jgi:hypothetical protein
VLQCTAQELRMQTVLVLRECWMMMMLYF